MSDERETDPAPPPESAVEPVRAPRQSLLPGEQPITMAMLFERMTRLGDIAEDNSRALHDLTRWVTNAEGDYTLLRGEVTTLCRHNREVFDKLTAMMVERDQIEAARRSDIRELREQVNDLNRRMRALEARQDGSAEATEP